MKIIPEIIYRGDLKEGNFQRLKEEMGQISRISGRRQWELGVGQRNTKRLEETTFQRKKELLAIGVDLEM